MVFSLSGSILKDIGQTRTVTGTPSKIIDSGVESGASTTAIINNASFLSSTNRATNSLVQSFETINLNFKNVTDSIKSIGANLNLGSGSANVGARGEIPSPRGGNITNDSTTGATSSVSGTDKVIESLEQFKSFLGPVGLGALVLIAILAVRK